MIGPAQEFALSDKAALCRSISTLAALGVWETLGYCLETCSKLCEHAAHVQQRRAQLAAILEGWRQSDLHEWVILAPDGIMLDVNTAWCRKVGLPVSALVGKDIWPMTPESVLHERQAVVAWVCEHGQGYAMMDHSVWSGAFLHVNLLPFLDAHDDVDQVAVLCEPVVERVFVDQYDNPTGRMRLIE